MTRPRRNASETSIRRSLQHAVAVGVLCGLTIPAPSFGYQNQLDSLATDLLVEISQSGHSSVAVVDFSDLNGNVTELGRFVAEELSAALVEHAQGLQVVDRLHLNRIIQEHKLATTGLLDPETARQLGKFAGVNLLVTGTLTSFGDTIRVSAKLLDVETARIIGSKRANLPKIAALADLLGTDLQGSVESGESQSEASSRTASGASGSAEFTEESYRSHRERDTLFELHGCRANGSNVVCELTITNEGEDRELSLFGTTDYPEHTTTLYDRFGGEHYAFKAQLGEQDDSSRATKMLIRSIPIPASFSFREVPAKATRIAALQIAFAFDYAEYRFKFRDVPLTR